MEGQGVFSALEVALQRATLEVALQRSRPCRMRLEVALQHSILYLRGLLEVALKQVPPFPLYPPSPGVLEVAL